MNRTKWIDFIFYLLLIVGITLSVTLALSLVKAWPYQLNLTNGELIDLNSSNVNETNFTIYVIHQTINNTNLVYLNYTNITQVTYTNITYANYTYPNATIYQNVTNVSYFNVTNVTCINCTYHYNTTSSFNDTILTNYLKVSDFDSYTSKGFLLISDFNATYATVKEKESPNTGLWIVSILAALLALIALFLIWRASQ